jgi:hypothetical protein
MKTSASRPTSRFTQIADATGPVRVLMPCHTPPAGRLSRRLVVTARLHSTKPSLEKAFTISSGVATQPRSLRSRSSGRGHEARRVHSSPACCLHRPTGSRASRPDRERVSKCGPPGERAGRQHPARVLGPEPRDAGSAPCRSVAVTRRRHPCPRVVGRDTTGGLRSPEAGGGPEPRRSTLGRSRRARA